ncbi:hypothetical protein K7472_19115 [Streptomyces sp. PTM05]|uniref:HTTM-like domain-containing protein n=1 Tax=Streptantibioticus parmotrematis TaxID=2873249 RepID=A0ABS7QVL4_9ACTN|nr:hypothetical protein [Streptantibioticus parmotrematis]MBY8886953.1 hypothetical protein [Streptantibioticus parmotrematis]
MRDLTRGPRRAAAAGLDRAIARVACREHRLIGLALLRIAIGVGTVMYCLADYGDRQFFWGPHSYNSPQLAAQAVPHLGFSLYFVSHSQWWFELLFHATVLVAAAFAVFGGRALTVATAVLMWSLYYRNQDVLEGGNNLVEILVIFMAFTVSNAYFAPGAKRRRQRLRETAGTPTIRTAAHNLGTYLIVFQTAVLYLTAGYWKVAGKVWQDGVAMYYISRVTGFQMSTAYAHWMSNATLGTAVCYFTVFVELAFPFAIVSTRPWVRKTVTVSVEAMHLGIMAFMGLVCFGLMMIGADCVCLRDEDYRAMWLRARRLADAVTGRLRAVDLLPSPAVVRLAEPEERHA